MRIHSSLTSNGSSLISHVFTVTLNLNMIIQTLNQPLIVVVRGFSSLELGVFPVIVLDIIYKKALGLSQILNKLFTEYILGVGVRLKEQTMFAASLEDSDQFVPKRLDSFISIVLKTHQNRYIE